jgi:hypothetical protein
MHTKTDQIRAAWATGDQIGALRIAARFFHCSADQSHEARRRRLKSPAILHQLGKPPLETVMAALRRWRQLERAKN